MTKNTKELIEHYAEKLFSTEIESSQIRSELRAQNYSSEEIDSILRRIDKNFMRLHQNAARRSKGRVLFFAGILIALAGAGVTLFTFLGLIDLGDRFIIAWGPVLGGIGMAFIGRLQMN